MRNKVYDTDSCITYQSTLIHEEFIAENNSSLVETETQRMETETNFSEDEFEGTIDKYSKFRINSKFSRFATIKDEHCFIEEILQRKNKEKGKTFNENVFKNGELFKSYLIKCYKKRLRQEYEDPLKKINLL